MLADAIRALYGHNPEATARVLEAARAVSAAQWTVPAPGEQSSLRDTLVHLASTQKGWLSWWDGSLPAAQAYALTLDPEAYPDAASLRTEWDAIHGQTEAFLDPLTDADMPREYT